MALRIYLPTWAGGATQQLSAQDLDFITQILNTTSQKQLFERMSPNDQHHALAVARTLQQAGHTHSSLMQAALLHDVGKSMGQPLVHRVVIVLLRAFWPAQLTRLSTQKPEQSIPQIRTWRRPFVINAQHPEIGATWAKDVDCDALTCHLIAKHQDKIITNEMTEMETTLLLALQQADDSN
ncbi:MAG: hypothetical protein AAF485_01195 [Chloroflexota bacterium]